MGFSQYFLDVIADRRCPSAVARGMLRAFSYLFRMGVALRHVAYEKGWITGTKLSVPVISVGNIAVGGTGKTPVVHLLVQALQEVCKVAIVSRGFRSEIERSGQVRKIASAGKVDCSAALCGDEPFTLGTGTLADVWVGADRVACGQKAISEGAECIVLDDGMQHRRLQRDFEIVVVDGKDPLCQERFLPRGRLRDLPSELRRADLLIANHVSDALETEAVAQVLKKYSDAPVVGVRVQPLEPEKIRGLRAGVFCGIGSPERFIETLRALDVSIVDALFVPDHCSPKPEELENFINKCHEKGATHILCTEKDWVKLPPSLKGVESVPMQLKIVSGQEHWDAFVQLSTQRITK